MDFARRLKEKYSVIPQPVKASFWFMVMSVLQKGIQFFVTPIYTRLLTTEEYGYYSVYSSWSSIFIVLATLNLSAGGFNVGMLKFEDDQKRYISSMQGLGNIATIFVCSIVFIFHKQIVNWTELSITVWIGIFILGFLNPSFSYWSQHQRYLYSYKKLIIVTLISAIMIPVISISFIFIFSNRKYAVIWGNIIVQAVVGGSFYIYNLAVGKSLYMKKYWVFALKFNLPLIPHYLSSIILGQSDRIMIGRYCGQSKAGIYSLAYTVSMMLNIIINAIIATYTPWTFQKMKEKGYKQINVYSNYILLMLGGVVACGVMVAPELIEFLGTDEYLEAKWIIAPVMLSCYYTMLYSLFANIEFYYEKSVAIMAASVTAALMNLFLNAVFIPIYGYTAAGYTTLLCYFILAVMHFIFAKRICIEKGIHGIYNIKFIAIFSAILTFGVMVLMLTYHYRMIRYGMILCMLLLFVIKRNKIIEIISQLRN